MSDTLRFGLRGKSKFHSRVNAFVVRRRTDAGFDAARMYAEKVAYEVSPPKPTLRPTVTFKTTNQEGTKVPRFGRRDPREVADSQSPAQLKDRRMAFLNE